MESQIVLVYLEDSTTSSMKIFHPQKLFVPKERLVMEIKNTGKFSKKYTCNYTIARPRPKYHTKRFYSSTFH